MRRWTHGCAGQGCRIGFPGSCINPCARSAESSRGAHFDGRDAYLSVALGSRGIAEGNSAPSTTAGPVSGCPRNVQATRSAVVDRGLNARSSASRVSNLTVSPEAILSLGAMALAHTQCGGSGALYQLQHARYI